MTKNVLIVGGGVIGLCAAYYARRLGHRVTVVDRHAPDHARCSHGNAGLVAPSHIVPLSSPGILGSSLKWLLDPESPFYIKPRPSPALMRWGRLFLRSATPEHVRRSAPLLSELNLMSRTGFEELAGELDDDFGLAKRGTLMVCKTAAALEHEAAVARRAAELGQPTEVLGAEATAKLEPQLRMDVAGSVYFEKDCHLVPERFMTALRRRLETMGAEFRWETEVTGWRTASSRIEALRTGAGDLTAEEYVVCGGSWSPEVVRGLDVRLPMQPGKGYSLTLPSPPRLPRLSSILMEARVAVTPMGSALRFGGTMELAGIDLRINPARVRGIVKSVPRYYPDFTAEAFRGVEPWCGLRPLSPDGLPFIGRPARHPNLVVATGHAMMGLSLGPITGKLIAELIEGAAPSVPLEALSPDRFN